MSGAQIEKGAGHNDIKGTSGFGLLIKYLSLAAAAEMSVMLSSQRQTNNDSMDQEMSDSCVPLQSTSHQDLASTSSTY